MEGVALQSGYADVRGRGRIDVRWGKDSRQEAVEGTFSFSKFEIKI